MDGTTIVFILTALIIGFVLSWLIVGRRYAAKNDFNEISGTVDESCESKEDVNRLLEQIASLKEEKTQMQENYSKTELKAQELYDQKVLSLKKEYDDLLNKVKNENKRLDSAFSLATEGKADESVKARLLDFEKSAGIISELESELEDLRRQQAALMSEREPLLNDLEVARTKCGTLDKKIKKLEDDLEEAEEDLEDLGKKLKNKNTELQKSHDELENSVRENKLIKAELEQREYELADKIKELKDKDVSLQFVQEILSAPETGAKDIKSKYSAIDFFESFLKGQFMDCNAFLYNTYSGLSFNDISGRDGFVEKKKVFSQMFDEWASVKRKGWLDKKTTIAFVGEFSAGKTSIVNRILSQDEPNIPRLPVSSKATTAIPTYIAGGVTTTYNFITPDNKLKTIKKETFEKVSKDVLDQIKGVSSLIKYFVMTYKNPNLNGLSILDTPGFNSNDSEDRERTIEVINECDALFWVFDVNTGTVNRSSIALIKEKLNKPLVVVINKVDTKATSEVDKVENLIKKTLSEEGLQVEKFIRFSAKAPLLDIMAPIHAIKHDDNRDEFIQIVENDIEELSDGLRGIVDDAQKEYQKCVKNAQSITNKYNDGISALWEACNEAAGIPHWEEHLFSSNRYEMSASEGGRLSQLLEDIASSHINNLADIYNQEMDAVAKEQQAYSDLVDFKASWQKVNDCMTAFKNAAKNLK